MTSCIRRLSTAALGAATLFAASAAVGAQPCDSCRPHYQPGLLAYLAMAFGGSATGGEYMVNQGPTYSGPAVIKPQPTYAPTPNASRYPYVPGEARVAAVELLPPTRTRSYPGVSQRRVIKRPTLRKAAKGEVTRSGKKGAPQIIRATAEVTIYGPERMDIRLLRTKK
jgi:hypothetical protein